MYCVQKTLKREKPREHEGGSARAVFGYLAIGFKSILAFKVYWRTSERRNYNLYSVCLKFTVNVRDA